MKLNVYYTYDQNDVNFGRAGRATFTDCSTSDGLQWSKPYIVSIPDALGATMGETVEGTPALFDSKGRYIDILTTNTERFYILAPGASTYSPIWLKAERVWEEA